MTLTGVGGAIRRMLGGKPTAEARARRFRAERERGLDGISDAELDAMTRELASGPDMQQALREAQALREQGSERRAPGGLQDSTHSSS